MLNNYNSIIEGHKIKQVRDNRKNIPSIYVICEMYGGICMYIHTYFRTEIHFSVFMEMSVEGQRVANISARRHSPTGVW